MWDRGTNTMWDGTDTMWDGAVHYVGWYSTLCGTVSRWVVRHVVQDRFAYAGWHCSPPPKKPNGRPLANKRTAAPTAPLHHFSWRKLLEKHKAKREVAHLFMDAENCSSGPATCQWSAGEKIYIAGMLTIHTSFGPSSESFLLLGTRRVSGGSTRGLAFVLFTLPDKYHTRTQIVINRNGGALAKLTIIFTRTKKTERSAGYKQGSLGQDLANISK